MRKSCPTLSWFYMRRSNIVWPRRDTQIVGLLDFLSNLQHCKSRMSTTFERFKTKDFEQPLSLIHRPVTQLISIPTTRATNSATVGYHRNDIL